MKSVVLLSGGLDSCVLLTCLLKQGQDVVALSVDYGQRHGARELAASAAIAEALGVERVVVDLSVLGEMGGSALTDTSTAVPLGHYEDETMRATVVPNRNMVLLSLAGALAVARGAGEVAYAAHRGDRAVYPDCRTEFVEAMRQALALAAYEPIALSAPFVHLTKGEVAALGSELGAPMALSWSCYQGGELHCGRCGTCVERREAFAIAEVADPTEYEP